MIETEGRLLTKLVGGPHDGVKVEMMEHPSFVMTVPPESHNLDQNDPHFIPPSIQKVTYTAEKIEVRWGRCVYWWRIFVYSKKALDDYLEEFNWVWDITGVPPIPKDVKVCGLME